MPAIHRCLGAALLPLLQCNATAGGPAAFHGTPILHRAYLSKPLCLSLVAPCGSSPAQFSPTCRCNPPNSKRPKQQFSTGATRFAQEAPYPPPCSPQDCPLPLKQFSSQPSILKQACTPCSRFSASSPSPGCARPASSYCAAALLLVSPVRLSLLKYRPCNTPFFPPVRSDQPAALPTPHPPIPPPPPQHIPSSDQSVRAGFCCPCPCCHQCCTCCLSSIACVLITQKMPTAQEGNPGRGAKGERKEWQVAREWEGVTRSNFGCLGLTGSAGSHYRAASTGGVKYSSSKEGRYNHAPCAGADVAAGSQMPGPPQPCSLRVVRRAAAEHQGDGRV